MHIQGRGRSISVASIESGVPESTLRDWDDLVRPHRLSNGALSQRIYDDNHMERIARIKAARDISRSDRTAHLEATTGLSRFDSLDAVTDEIPAEFARLHRRGRSD